VRAPIKNNSDGSRLSFSWGSLGVTHKFPKKYMKIILGEFNTKY
jgi:hypothetical protein